MENTGKKVYALFMVFGVRGDHELKSVHETLAGAQDAARAAHDKLRANGIEPCWTPKIRELPLFV